MMPQALSATRRPASNACSAHRRSSWTWCARAIRRFTVRSYTFGTLRLEPDGPVQEVIITDAAGTQWLALYSMELQPDGTWKISGCSLVKAPPNTA